MPNTAVSNLNHHAPVAGRKSPPRRWQNRDFLLLGILAAMFFAAHAFSQGVAGKATNLFWACHAGAALVAIGLLLKNPTANAIGTLILFVGLPLWAINLLFGGAFYPTSVLTHVGGLSYGILGMRQLGLPRLSWLAALGGVMGLLVASYLWTPPADNVNLVFKAWGPWARLFDQPREHLYLLVLLWAMALYSSQSLLAIFCSEEGLLREPAQV